MMALRIATMITAFRVVWAQTALRPNVALETQSLLTGDSPPIVLGQVKAKIRVDNLEILLSLSQDGCLVTSSHICNVPTKTYSISDGAKEVPYAIPLEDVYNFVCMYEDDFFVIAGHAQVICKEELVGLTGVGGEGSTRRLQGNEYSYEAYYEIPVECEGAVSTTTEQPGDDTTSTSTTTVTTTTVAASTVVTTNNPSTVVTTNAPTTVMTTNGPTTSTEGPGGVHRGTEMSTTTTPGPTTSGGTTAEPSTVVTTTVITSTAGPTTTSTPCEKTCDKGEFLKGDGCECVLDPCDACPTGSICECTVDSRGEQQTYCKECNCGFCSGDKDCCRLQNGNACVPNATGRDMCRLDEFFRNGSNKPLCRGNAKPRGNKRKLSGGPNAQGKPESQGQQARDCLELNDDMKKVVDQCGCRPSSDSVCHINPPADRCVVNGLQ